MIGYDSKRKTYYVQYKYRDADSKKHTTMKRGFALKREAVEYEAQLKLNKVEHKPRVDKTFREMSVLWENDLQSSADSRMRHKEHFEKRFGEYVDKPIAKITKSQLVEWRSWLSTTEYATKTKNDTISFVRSVFKFANDIYGVPNTAVVLKRFKKTNAEVMVEMQTWTVEEFIQFSSVIENRLYKIFFDTLFWTGARRGEIIALQCSDLCDGYISIHSSQRTQIEGLKPTKTRCNRKVRLDTELYKELLELKEHFKEGYLFGGDACLSPTTIDRHFRKGIADSGVKPIRLHDLRHSHATWLINNGVNIVAVSKRLGHTDIETTLKTYTHLLEDTDREMMEIIERKKLVV